MCIVAPWPCHQTHQISVPKQDFRKVNFCDGDVPFWKFVKLQFKHFCLQIIHELIKSLVMQILIAFLAEKVHLQSSINFVTPL